MKRRLVPIHCAVVLYGILGSWGKVARALRRGRFTASGLFNAVRRYDLGKAK